MLNTKTNALRRALHGFHFATLCNVYFILSDTEMSGLLGYFLWGFVSPFLLLLIKTSSWVHVRLLIFSLVLASIASGKDVRKTMKGNPTLSLHVL